MPRRLLFAFLVLLSVSCTNRVADHKDKSVFRYNEASGVTSLDPAFARDQANIWATSQLYNGLVQLDNQLNIQPCIASHWEVSDSGRTYLFHLRKDVYFHQNECFKDDQNNNTSGTGRRVLASDFIFSLRRLTDPSTASPGAWVMTKVRQDTDGIVAVNDSTLLIRLQEPFAPFLGLLSMPYCSVVPKEVVEHYGTDFRNHPCGTGPFRFSYWKEGVKLILLKNEHYFETHNGSPLPYLDAVEVSFISDKQSAFIEFLKGNLDFLSGLDPSYKDELLTRSGQLQPRHAGRFNMTTEPYLNTEYLGIFMDSTGPLMHADPLRMLKVRQALSYGFDKARMITFLRNNMGTPGIYGMVPPGLPSFDSTAEYAYGYDPQRARQLLSEAGFPDGKEMPEIVLSTTTTYQDLCEYMKSQWQELGIKVRIDVNQAAVHRKMVAEQKLAFFRGSWIADYPDAENYLSLFYSGNFTPGGPNYTHFRDPRFDTLYEQANREVNDSLRYVYYREMDQLVMRQAPVIVLYYDKVLRLTQKNIEGLGSNAMNLLILKQVKKIPQGLK